MQGKLFYWPILRFLLFLALFLTYITLLGCKLGPDSDETFQNWGSEEIQKLLATDGTDGDSLGFAVSISGDTAIVGARYDDTKGMDSGSAYIYKTFKNTDWLQVAKLTASDGSPDDNFGFSVELNKDGDVAIVGSIWDDANGIDSGSAYIFKTTDGRNWSQAEKLTALDGLTNDKFGVSVDIDGEGNTAIVGAFLDDENEQDSGSAYIFNTTDGSNWEQTQQLTASNGAANDCFGRSVSISENGNTVIVGSYYNDYDSYRKQTGRAYIYQTTDGSFWTERAKLNANDLDEYDLFGFSVDIDSEGNTAIIGAPGADLYYTHDGINYFGRKAGAAYIFSTPDGQSWKQQDKLIANDPTGGDSFGTSVSIDPEGDTVIVGSTKKDIVHEGTPDFIYKSQGCAYVYNKSEDLEWNQKVKIIASDGAENDLFGNAVGICGDTAVIGVCRDDDNGTSSGSAYVFNLHKIR